MTIKISRDNESIEMSFPENPVAKEIALETIRLFIQSNVMDATIYIKNAGNYKYNPATRQYEA